MTTAPHEIDRQIRLVCFDLGGVVVRICRSWQEGCIAAGLDVRHTDDSPSRAHERFELTRQHQTGVIDCDTYAQRMSELLDGAYSPKEVRAIHDAWMFGEYEGVASLIDRINQTGVETAALSNTSHSHWQRLLHFPSIQRMTHRAASHLLGRFKPDPAIYAAFEAQVRRLPHEILFFDDLAENIEAAQRLGWVGVQIDHNRCTASQIHAALIEHRVLCD